jgi:hypothetical protein
VIGLRSPSSRIIQRGDDVSAGVDFWGGLSARAGLIADHDEAFLKTAAAYFDGLIAWYEAADIGVAGQAVFAAVTERLARGGLWSALNSGHVTGHDEWIHTPIRPGSPERIVSGMPFQVDIIPTPMRVGWALNCEDGVVFADTVLRAELNARHPAPVEWIEARRRFVRAELPIPIKDAILPLSSTPYAFRPSGWRPDDCWRVRKGADALAEDRYSDVKDYQTAVARELAAAGSANASRRH